MVGPIPRVARLPRTFDPAFARLQDLDVEGLLLPATLLSA